MRVKIKGFKIFKDRHGKTRCYHRATKTPIDIQKWPLGTTGFLAECKRIANILLNKNSQPGTLGALIGAYRLHPAFTELKPKTKHGYDYNFSKLEAIFDTPLIYFNPPLIVKIRDNIAEENGWSTGNHVKTALSIVFAWGRERGYMRDNPAASVKKMKRPKDLAQPNRPWGDEEREAVLAALPAHMILPFSFMIFCGLDPVDVVALSRNSVRGGLIDSKRAKTNQPVWIPLPKPVQDALTAAPLHTATTICVNSKGIPWTVGGLNSSWQGIKKRLLAEGKIQPGLTLKGTRHTVGTVLAEMGYDDRTIADMLGQQTLAMAQHYSRRANRSRKLSPVVRNFEEEMNRRRTKIVKPT